MRYKLLGKSGLRVSELCLGTMIFGDDVWGASREESRKIYEAFRQSGGNFIDTANTYGESEEFLSEFISGQRDELVLATKFTGFTRKEDVNSSGNHRKSMTRAIENSLRRLKTDYIDLYWIHTWDFITPVEEIMRSFDDLVRQGKVLYIGVSNAPAWTIAHANTLASFRGWTQFISLQVEYNLIERSAERELLPMAEALNLGVTAWAPLAAGWLTGKYIELESEAKRSEKYRLDHKFAAAFVDKSDRNKLIAKEVARVGAEIDRPPSQISLNWLRQHGVIPIFGARTKEQALENLGCLDFKLSDDEMKKLDAVSRIKIGYPYDLLKKVKGFTYGGLFDSLEGNRAIGI